MNYYQKTLVMTSVLIVLSISTIYIETKGVNMYPFFHYKLYTQPLGNKKMIEIYRLYKVTATNDTLRLKFEDIKSFDTDSYGYYIDYVAHEIEDTDSAKKNQVIVKLKAFVKYLYPNVHHWLLAKESYICEDFNISKKSNGLKIIYEYK